MPTEGQVPYFNYIWHGISHNHPQTPAKSRSSCLHFLTTPSATDRQSDTLRYHIPVLYFIFSAECRHIPAHYPSALPLDISNVSLHQPAQAYIDRPVTESNDFSRVARASLTGLGWPRIGTGGGGL
jgi:hypothetical protein